MSAITRIWSNHVYELLKEHVPDAACSLTMIHRGTGYPFASVVLRKGVWDYIVLTGGNFLINLRRTVLTLRGDGEFSLQSLLRALAAKVRASGVSIKIEASPKGSHQSIGGAENATIY